MSFLLDESAHARWHQPVVAARLHELLRADLLAIARPSVLEIGFSARSPQDHRDVIADITEAMTVIELSGGSAPARRTCRSASPTEAGTGPLDRWTSCWPPRPSSTS
ncbi:PIN domain-containing protein [Kineococcus esterisolvens]|uniref:hypothetical protein n=1 Tax=unclassified Kineococcus TaxID=2621656 RepID=UPI003D7D4566